MVFLVSIVRIRLKDCSLHLSHLFVAKSCVRGGRIVVKGYRRGGAYRRHDRRLIKNAYICRVQSQ